MPQTGPCLRLLPIVIATSNLLLQPAWSDTSDYETPPVVSAADILPAELLKSDYHEVDDAVRNDGYLNYYTIRSDYGDFEATSDTMLRIRVREIEALAELDEISKTEVFIEAAADAGVNQLKTVAEFATHPIETVTGIPAGIGRLFTRTKRQASEGAETAKDYVAGDEDEETDGDDDGTTSEEVTGAATSLAGTYLGVSSAERAWHRELGTDPYTSNEVLQKAVNSVAWADRLGRFGIRAAGLPKIPGVGVLGDVNDVVWGKDPYELQDFNRARLIEAGANEELIDQFFDNPALSPSQQTYLIAAIAQLDTMEGRAGIVRQSLDVRTETEALFFVESVVLLAWYHRNENPLVAINAELTIPFGIKADGRKIALFAVDHVYWTETIAETADRYVDARGGTDDQTHDVWISGVVSERTRSELTELGWDIHENLTIMADTDSTESR